MASSQVHGIAVTVAEERGRTQVQLAADKTTSEPMFEALVSAVAAKLHARIEQIDITRREKFAQMKLRARKISRVMKDITRAINRCFTDTPAKRRRDQQKRRMRPPRTIRTRPVRSTIFPA